MNLSTIPFFTHDIDKCCTICHVILKDTESTHSIFSTLEELESPMNVLQVLQSFSNFTFYNGPQMVCTMCYDKTIEVYKFIQMCNKAHENSQHYLKNIEAIKTIKDGTDVDVKIEEISIAPTRIIIGKNFLEEIENEKITKFDELEMVISDTEIKIEETILQEGMEKEIKTIKDQTDVGIKFEEISIEPTRIIINGRKFEEEMENEKITKFEELGMAISNAEILTEKETGSSDFDNLRVEKIDAHKMPDERIGCNKCKECHLVFSDKKELRYHRKEAKCTKEKQFLGELCNDFVGTRYNLTSHEQKHNSQRAHISKDLTPKQGRHQPPTDHETDVHTVEKPFTCLTCKRGFTAPSSLRRHMNSHNGVKSHKCEQCDRRFTAPSALRRHLNIHSGVKAHKCEQCDQRFAQASYLRTHMDIHNGIKAHKCEQCDRRFTAPSALRRHLNIHSGVRAHKCEQCGQLFTRAANLRFHMHIHNGEAAHKCEQCDRRFAQASHLRTHMDIHNGVIVHKCEQCDRQFSLVANLRRHMNIHTGVKPHKCEQCDRRFADPSALRSHLRIHSGVKAHKCEQCDRLFTQAANLRMHMHIHNEEKAHKCEQCDRRFTDLSALREHLNIHSGLKPHKCEHCDRRFVRASHLRMHMKIHNRKRELSY